LAIEAFLSVPVLREYKPPASRWPNPITGYASRGVPVTICHGVVVRFSKPQATILEEFSDLVRGPKFLKHSGKQSD
jgi:hypothetical protein